MVGDISALAVLTELRYVALGETSVRGTLSSLTSLTHLGEEFVRPDGLSMQGVLWLGSTGVSGAIGELQRLPGLGEKKAADGKLVKKAWGGYRLDFSSCAVFEGGCPDGQSPHADPSSVAGRDVAACCVAAAVHKEL